MRSVISCCSKKKKKLSVTLECITRMESWGVCENFGAVVPSEKRAVVSFQSTTVRTSVFMVNSPPPPTKSTLKFAPSIFFFVIFSLPAWLPPFHIWPRQLLSVSTLRNLEFSFPCAPFFLLSTVYPFVDLLQLWVGMVAFCVASQVISRRIMTKYHNSLFPAHQSQTKYFIKTLFVIRFL